MIKIQVLFFGKLKESWGTNKLEVETGSHNIEDLYLELLNKAANIPHKESIKVAINDEFVNWDTTINSGDTIAFLPPASGG
ncbi:MAG: MoaD/ThiS family protein [Alcanivoracaceae bacterium]|nr:MoaD/ThiS family protein [Alcanivoracaceae bacterium]